MSTSGWEQGKDVIVNDERQPMLYDAAGRPLERPTGFPPSPPDKEAR